MSTPPSSHNVAQQNYVDPASLPVRRKRGRPRKDEAVSEQTLRAQQQRVNSNASSSRGLVGQAVSGILDGTFDAGYLLTVRVGTTGPVFKGVLFDPRLSPPITAENDIAPNLPMLSQNDFIVAEQSSQASELTPGQPVRQNIRAVEPILRPDYVAVPTSGQPVQQNVRTIQLTQRNEPAAAPTPAQPSQQNVKDFHPIHKNEPTAVHAPVHVRAVQSFEGNKAATVPVPDLLVQQNAVAVRSLQRSEPTAVPSPALPVQQNIQAIKPYQVNEPSVVHTLAHHAEHNVKTVQPVLGDGSASVFTQTEAVQSNVRDGLSIPEVTPGILSQSNQTASSLYTEQVVLNGSGCALHSDSTPTDLQFSGQVESSSNPSTSAIHSRQVESSSNPSTSAIHSGQVKSSSNPSTSTIHQPLKYEVKNGQSAASVGLPATVVKEKEVLVTIQSSDNQSGGVEASKETDAVPEPKETDAVPQQLGHSSCSTNWTQQSAKILSADEIVSGIPDFTSQMPHPETLVEECKSELQDVWIGQFGASTPSAFQDSIYDPKLVQVDGSTALEFSKPTPPGDDSV